MSSILADSTIEPVAHEDIHTLLVSIGDNQAAYAAIRELFYDFMAPRPAIFVVGCLREPFYKLAYHRRILAGGSLMVGPFSCVKRNKAGPPPTERRRPYRSS